MLTTLLLSACALANEPAATEEAPAPTATAPTEEAAGSHRDVTVADLAARLDAGTATFVLDVRTAGEFAGGHVPGAVNIPVGDLPSRMNELEAHKGSEIWTICAVGGRSAAAAGQLAAAGYTAVNVDGGTNGWVEAGHAVEK